MTWFKVDDSFHSHPKVLAAEPAALGLWVVAGAWSSASLTDGFVPDHVLPRLLPDAAKLAEQLVTCGLWRRAKGGHRFHDWGHYNPSSVTVKRERDAARERMRSLRAKRKAPGQPENCSAEQPPNVRPKFATPTRPDPTRSSPDGEPQEDTPPASPGTPKRTDRGSRLPDEFAVTPEMTAWARENAPTCGPANHEAFCDYWRSVPGAKGRKVDWVATWRNWMRREHERHATPQVRTAPTPAPRIATGDQRAIEIQALKAEMTGTGNTAFTVIQGELT